MRTGEVLRLLYKEKLIELEAAQSRRYTANKFEEQLRENIETFQRGERAGLDMTSVFSLEMQNPLFYYTLKGGGTVYNISYEEGEFQIQKKLEQQLEEISPDMQLTEHQCQFISQEGISVLSVPIPWHIEECDIVLNSKFILFVTSNYYGATIRKFQWDIIPRLQGKTLDQMKELLRLTHISRRPTSLEITLPC